MTIPEKVGSRQGFLVCRVDEVRDVIERVAALMQLASYQRHDIFGVELALEEALANALRHGNGLDPSKKVRVDCCVGSDQVWIEIEDEGEGFCFNDVQDPTLPENIGRPGGRGLLFIRTYMNAVTFNDVGNRVTMQKHRTRSVISE